MGAVLLCARAELRGRLRTWLGLALLLGLVAGVVIAAAAGARRTDSAYERFLAHQRAADVFVPNYPDPGVATFDPPAVAHLPQVAESARGAFFYIGDTGAIAPADERLGRTVNRLKLVRGRLPSPGRVDEIAVGFERARVSHWHVGTAFPLVESRYAAQAARLGVRNVRLRVVGLVAAPGEFPPLEEGAPSIYATPAFYRAYEHTPLVEDAGHAVLARLRHGAADVPAFRAGLVRLARGRPFGISTQAEQAADVERSLHLQAVAVWLLAAVLVLTGAMIAGQALARHAFIEARDNATLRALGMTRRQIWAVGVLRALALGAIAATVALGLATALSPLAPLGNLARTAEPDPGASVDVTAFAVGTAATLLEAVLLAAPAAWWAARRTPGGADPAARRAPLAVRAVARLGAGAPILTGVRLALERGRGRSAVPVRTTLVGVTVGVGALAAALTFASSSAHLLDTPRLYGWNWDIAVTNYGQGPDLLRAGPAAVRGEPAVEAFSAGALGFPTEIDGRRVDGIALEPIRGSAGPPVIEGRAPAARGEVALGAKTMRALGVSIGDPVTVRMGGAGVERMRVVGKAVLAAVFSNNARLGQGAVLLYRDVRRLAPSVPAQDGVLRLRPGTDRRTVVRRLSRRLGELQSFEASKPVDVVDFGRVRGLPLIGAGLLAALAAATLAHLVSSAVRRRRRDLAVLKTLGFERRQVRAIVVAQSLTYAALALLVGLPLGVAAGRLAWDVFADREGIAPEVVVPVPALLVVIPAAALLAAAIAVLPARAAAATHPAVVLRAE